MTSSLSGIGAGYGAYSLQDLFNEIDTDSSGSITKSELENAVTDAGGTTQAADTLYATLDPNNTGSVSEQQFAQNLPLPPLSDQTGAQMIQAQALFSQIDSNGDGSISKSELESAVTQAGGTTAAADELYAQLDPNNTGQVNQQQFANALPSPTGATAEDAVVALMSQNAPSASGNSAQDALAALTSYSASTSGSSTGVTGTSNSALMQLLSGAESSMQDPLLSLLNGGSSGSSSSMFGSGGTGSSMFGSDSSADSSLFALLQSSLTSSSGSSTGTSSGSSSSNGLDLSTAMALYQSQMTQQAIGSMFGSGSSDL